MEPLFEVSSERYSDIPCKVIVDYNGRHFPPIINELLHRYMGSVMFGGSSLIHDLYFREEEWDRDYDLWCNSNAFSKIANSLSKMESCDKIKDDIYIKNNDYYGRFSSEGITEFNLRSSHSISIRIQLINVGNLTNFSRILESVDLTFNTVFFDGTKLIFVDTTEEQIRSKIGFFRPYKHKSSFCSCYICSNRNSRLTEKEIGRLEKYRLRGFKIENICPFCDFENCLSISHTIKCWKEKLSMVNSSFYDIENVLTPDKITGIIEFIEKNTNDIILFSGLLLILSTKNIKLFEQQFAKYKVLIDPYSSNFNSMLYYVVDSGSTTLFNKFFEIMQPLITPYSYKRINQLINIAYRKNYLKIATSLSSVSPRFKIDIFEDKIISFDFISVFECYLETSDPQVIRNEFSKIKILDKPDELEICPICCSSNSNLILECGHKYCDVCLVKYFLIQEKNNNKLKCPLCRVIL